MSFTPDTRGTLSSNQQVARAIGIEIVNGVYEAGDKLPGEAKILDRFGISRTVLREAFKILSAKGLIVSKTRVGTKVLPRTSWNLFDPDVLSWHVADGIDEKLRADLLAHPALGQYLHGLWDELLAWLHADLQRPESSIGARISALSQELGERLAADAAMRRLINEQVTAAAPLAIERYREDIRRYIVERVDAWNTHEMTAELERNVGRDLQFIRINGTLVGGLVGLGIHAATQWLRG